MTIGKHIKEILGFLTGDAIAGAIKTVKSNVEEGAKTAVKSLILFLMYALGMLFLLVGIAQYIQDAFSWSNGMGLIVVGVVLLLLGIIAKALK